MDKLFKRAKPDDADLLSEVQSFDLSILVAMDVSKITLEVLTVEVVDWLQVSSVGSLPVDLHNSRQPYNVFPEMPRFTT